MPGEQSGTDLNRKTSATNTGTQTNAGKNRFPKIPNAVITATKLIPIGGTYLASAEAAYNNYVSPPVQQPNVVAEEKTKGRNSNQPPDFFKYNLPPHAWSLPVRPAEVIGNNQVWKGAYPDSPKLHRERRGVIWFWDTSGGISAIDKDTGEAKTARQKEAENNKSAGKTEDPLINKYGFQFLWNPETISTSVERNMDVTPTSADRLRSVAGAFPGQETYSFTVTLDRVNDFACIKQMVDSTGQISDLFKYYKYGLYPRSEADMAKDIFLLSRYGTMADIEYLYKAINGDGGSDGSSWTTLLGKPTSAIGYLAPQLLAFRFGPDSTQSLSFVGWITNLSFNHTYFTEEMIPLRTTVTFSCQAFAGAAIT